MSISYSPEAPLPTIIEGNGPTKLLVGFTYKGESYNSGDSIKLIHKQVEIQDSGEFKFENLNFPTDWRISFDERSIYLISAPNTTIVKLVDVTENGKKGIELKWESTSNESEVNIILQSLSYNNYTNLPIRESSNPPSPSADQTIKFDIYAGPPASPVDVGDVSVKFTPINDSPFIFKTPDGMVSSPLPLRAFNQGVELQDGSVIVFGTDRLFVGNQSVSMLKLLPDGQPDPDFGINGTITLETGSTALRWIRDVAYDSSTGKILICGGGLGEMAVVELNVDGSLNKSFGNNGVLEFSTAALDIQSLNNESSYIHAVSYVTRGGTDGILVAGQVNNKPFLGLFDRSGQQLTASKGTSPALIWGEDDGNINDGLSFRLEQIESVAEITTRDVTELGGTTKTWIYTVGGMKSSPTSSSESVAIRRFDLETGKNDLTFGENGLVKISVAGSMLLPNGMKQFTDGSMVIVGGITDKSTGDAKGFALKVSGNGEIVSTFGKDGFVWFDSYDLPGGFGPSDKPFLYDLDEFSNGDLAISGFVSPIGFPQKSFVVRISKESGNTINNYGEDFYGVASHDASTGISAAIVTDKDELILPTRFYGETDWVNFPSRFQAAVAKFDRNGDVDESFGVQEAIVPGGNYIPLVSFGIGGVFDPERAYFRNYEDFKITIDPVYYSNSDYYGTTFLPAIKYIGNEYFKLVATSGTNGYTGEIIRTDKHADNQLLGYGNEPETFSKNAVATYQVNGNQLIIKFLGLDNNTWQSNEIVNQVINALQVKLEKTPTNFNLASALGFSLTLVDSENTPNSWQGTGEPNVPIQTNAIDVGDLSSYLTIASSVTPEGQYEVKIYSLIPVNAIEMTYRVPTTNPLNGIDGGEVGSSLTGAGVIGAVNELEGKASFVVKDGALRVPFKDSYGNPLDVYLVGSLTFDPKLDQIPVKTFEITSLRINGELVSVPEPYVIPDRTLKVSVEHWMGGKYGFDTNDMPADLGLNVLVRQQLYGPPLNAVEDREDERFVMTGMGREDAIVTVEMNPPYSYDPANLIDAEDALRVLQLSVGKVQAESGYQLVAADVNNDQVVSAMDAYSILQTITGPNLQSNWIFIQDNSFNLNNEVKVNNVAYNRFIQTPLTNGDQDLKVVAVLKGDVVSTAIDMGLRFNGTPNNDDKNGTVVDDLLLGDLGNDTLNGLSGSDIIDGGDGSDSLNGGPGNDYLLGKGGDDSIIGGPGRDSLVGGSGNDFIVGGKWVFDASTKNWGFDFSGGYDDNIIIGGPGADKLLSTPNAKDVFEFDFSTLASDSTMSSMDTIYGFDGFDYIIIEHLGDLALTTETSFPVTNLDLLDSFDSFIDVFTRLSSIGSQSTNSDVVSYFFTIQTISSDSSLSGTNLRYYLLFDDGTQDWISDANMIELVGMNIYEQLSNHIYYLQAGPPGG